MTDKQAALALSDAPVQITRTPMQMLEAAFNQAIAQGSAMEVVDRILGQQKWLIENQAKIDWQAAMQRSQRCMKPIRADLENPQTRSRYASYAQLDKVLRPIYSEEGFSLSFNTKASMSTEMLIVTCDVSRGGHTEHYEIPMPADGKGAKGGDVMTKTHATGSAASYGMRYLLKMIFNVAIGETDDDGNGASGSDKRMDDTKLAEWCEYIADSLNEDQLKGRYIEAQKAADAAGDTKAALTFASKKNDVLRKIKGGQR